MVKGIPIFCMNTMLHVTLRRRLSTFDQHQEAKEHLTGLRHLILNTNLSLTLRVPRRLLYVEVNLSGDRIWDGSKDEVGK